MRYVVFGVFALADWTLVESKDYPMIKTGIVHLFETYLFGRFFVFIKAFIQERS